MTEFCHRSSFARSCPITLPPMSLIEAAGVKILRDTVADKGGGMVRSAIRFHEIERLPADPLPLVFGGNIQGLQGDYIGFVYRQVADVLPVLSDQVHRIRRMMDPQQLHFPVPVPVKVIYHAVGVNASVCGAPDSLPQGDNGRHILFGCLNKQLFLGHAITSPSGIFTQFPHSGAGTLSAARLRTANRNTGRSRPRDKTVNTVRTSPYLPARLL